MFDKLFCTGSIRKRTRVDFYEGEFLPRLICALFGHKMFNQERRNDVYFQDKEVRVFDIGCRRCGHMAVVEVHPLEKFEGIDHLVSTGYSDLEKAKT